MRLMEQKSQTNLLIEKVIRCQILKQKRLPRNSCSKGFAGFRTNVSEGVHIQKSYKIQVFNFNFTKDRLHHVLPQPTSAHLDTCSQLLSLLCNSMEVLWGFFISHKSF